MYNFQQDNDLDIIAHLGDDYEKHNDAVIPPIYMNSLHVMPKEAIGGPQREYSYGRVNNPTVEVFEKKVAALERAEHALAFGSGMAAISSCLIANLSAGDHVVAVDTSYGPTRMFIAQNLSKYGVEHTFVTGEDINQFKDACRPNTKVFYLESPSSMVFLIQDLRAIAALAKEKGVVTMIDNSWATPLYQKPVELGIDISIHTVSKYIGGHSDIIAGVASLSGEEPWKRLRDVRSQYGGILGPMEAWLATRGLRSMPLRVKEHGKNALEIARRLEKHPKVARVRHPGLESDPGHAVAKSQMTGFTSPFCVELACGTDDAREFVKRLKCFNLGPSWGGFESMTTMPYPASQAFRRPRKPADAAPPNADEAPEPVRNLIRLHVGLEDIETLYADLEASLNKI